MTNYQEFVEAEKNNIVWYIKEAVEPLSKHTMKAGVLNRENYVMKGKFKDNISAQKRKSKAGNKILGQIAKDANTQGGTQGYLLWLSR